MQHCSARGGIDHMPPSIATGNLQRARQSADCDGIAAVGALIAALREVEVAAAADDADLARVGRIAADALQHLGDDAVLFARHRDRILEHVDLLVDYASDLASGRPAPLLPPLLCLPDAVEEQHLLATIAIFVGNALGTVADLEEEILAAESHTGEAEAIAAIRRAVHTFKAEFGVLQMAPAQRLCHVAETLIDACTEAKRAFPADVMLEVADWLQQYLDRLAKDPVSTPPPLRHLLDKMSALLVGPAAPVPPPGSPALAAAVAPRADEPRLVLRVEGDFADSLNDFVTEARAHLGEAEGALIASTDGIADPEQINLTFRAFHSIKGVAGFLGLFPVVELAHLAETVLDEARSGRLLLTLVEIDLLLTSVDCLGQMLAALEGQPAPLVATYEQIVERLRAAAKGRGTDLEDAPVTAAAAIDDAVRATAPAPVADLPVAMPPGPVAAAPTVLTPAPRPALFAAAHDGKAAKIERSVKVNTTRLDLLVDMVGELVIAQSMVLQDPAFAGIADPLLVRNIAQVEKITRDLQETAMSLRMVTVKATFQKMARLVRDVASKAGKRVQLTLHGEDTELDRTVVEQISDPLVHMLRNAVDHGIETTDVRRRAGKFDAGRLSLRAYHQGGSIVIEIADDGRGIDQEKVLRKAIERGLLPPTTRLEDLSDQEVHAILFMPGFSTADKVTDLSGRGVGMDVVRRNIEALRGKIEIDSRLGHGTTFRLRLPLTLAIIDGMLLRVGGERYVLPTMAIERSFLAETKDVHRLEGRGECILVRDEVLPVYRLRDVLGLADGVLDLTAGILVVVEVDGQRACLFVDEILGQQQVVIKALGTAGGRVCGVSGGAIMSDGRVALILDVAALVEVATAV